MFISTICLLALATLAPMDAQTLKNPGFELGTQDWKTEGHVEVETTKPLAGKASLQIGPGKGAIRQRYEVPGLRILWFGAKLTPSAPNVDAKVHLECFDKKGRRLMNLTGHLDPKTGAAIYLKTHAFTHHIIVSVEKGEQGTLIVDDAQLQDDDKNKVEHPPQVDLDAAMHPFWQSGPVIEESALLLSTAGGPATGNLLYRPTKILSVKDSTYGTTFKEGQDFTIQANKIIAIKGSKIPVMSDTEFATGEFPWTTLDGRHIFVSYEHNDTWTGPIPQSQATALPRTVALLKEKKPLTIVAYGDSITLGINVSGFRSLFPYMPPWPTLAVHELERLYGNKKIRLYNTALGGMNSQWAKDNAKEAVASLKPDLVLIAFGMNDFWSLTPDQYRENINETIKTIKSQRPTCEFILVAPMKFDPAYTNDPTYNNNLSGYAPQLKTLTTQGIALLDMTTLTDALYKAKSAKDLTTDPMHPDDYLSQIHAQSLIATLK